MSDISEITVKLELTSAAIKDAFASSYQCLIENPQLKDEIVEEWKKSINDFLKYTVDMSEKRNNNELSKAITKAFIFGKR